LGLFLSTVVNKVDAKGRVSLPAHFRASLAGQSFHGVVLFPSQHYSCLEGFGWDYMEEISRRLENFDFFSNQQDDLATTIFGESVELPLDGDGRLVLPQNLRDHAGLDSEAAFVGLGRKFQIWQPLALEKRKQAARAGVQSGAFTLPKGDV
jgi:MraZ protein